MSTIKLILSDGRAIMPSAANEKAVKNVLAKRLKFTTLESVRVISDATVQMRRRLKFPMHRWEELKIGCFAPLNPRLAKSRQRIWSIILSWGVGKVRLRR